MNLIAWRRFLAASAVLFTVTTGGIAGAAVSSCKLVKVEDWPIRVQGNLILVDGAINGRKISVVPDTGTTNTLIFRAAAVRLGVPLSSTTNVRMFGMGGETKVDVALVDEFRVGQATQKELRILVAGENEFGDDVGVLLGEDFFQRFDVEFDVAHNAVRLFQPKDCDGVSLAYWARTGATEVEFEAVDVNRPEIILAVQINGQPLKAKLDSGAALSMLDRADAERVGITPETPGVVVGGRSIGLGKNAVDSWIGPFQSFAIGNETIRDTQIRFSDIYKDATYRSTGSNVSHKLQVSHAMLLGADFLRSHRVLVAHSQRKIYFTYTGGPVFQLNRPPVPADDPLSEDNAKPGTSAMARAGEAEWRANLTAGTAAFRAGDYGVATAKFEAALREAESFGGGDPRLATTLNNFAGVYQAQGRYAEAEPLLRRSLAIREKALGPDHPDVGQALNSLAELYRAQGRYADAEPLYRRALAIVEKARGPEHRDAAASLNNLALLYQAQGRYAEAEPLFHRSLEIAEKVLGPDHRDVAQSLNNVAGLYQAQGRYAEAEPLFRRSLAIREKALGPDHRDVGQSLNNVAGLYRAQGRYAEAEPLFRRSLAIVEKALGSDHPDVGSALNNLAELYRAQGRYADAEPLYRRALGIREKALGRDHPGVAGSLNNLALLYQAQGRYADAEPLFHRSLEIAEKALGPDHRDVGQSLNNVAGLYRAQGRYAEAEPLYRRSLAIWEKALGPDHPDVAGALNSLAGLYGTQGRYAEAEPLIRRSLAIREKALGPDHPDVAGALNSLAGLYGTQGRYAEAEPLIRRSLAIQEKAMGPDHPAVASSLSDLASLCNAQGRFAEVEPLYRRALVIQEKALGPNHPGVGAVLNNLAYFYQAQGRYAEADPLLHRALGIQEKALGPDHPALAASSDSLASLYQAQGRYAEAEPLYRHSLAIWEKALGPDHPSVGRALNTLARLYREQGKLDEALALTRRANVSLARRFAAENRGSRQGLLAEQRSHSEDFQFHVALLAAVAERGSEVRAEAAAESFRIAQLARANDTAEQVGKMAARYAAGSDALAKLARARQDALAKFDQLDTRIVEAAGQRGNETLAAKLRSEQAETVAAVAELDVRLEREYPKYRELINPKPLEIATAEQLLGNDEALVLFLVSGDESYLWALRRGDAGFFRLPVKRNELVDVVKNLRAQLDLGVSDPEAMLKKPFDVAAAHALYRKILAPADVLLAGATQLIVVPDGALQSLPTSVLVTELPAKPVVAPADHAQVAWLAKKYAITVLPAVASLRALRQFAKPPTSREPFGGFGDPLLGGGDEGARRTNIGALYSRGAVADVNEVRRLPRLRETADELRAIAAELKAPATSLWLGSAATERAVKEADLSRFRNLAFATHGLMAGDFMGLAEPALVLTPPAQGSELDDGLLTAGEISQLKLDADWVVLSACNTAAPDGTAGAEGLSGLAKAFFYAGARSLLVSHWSVSSDAAMALTTRMFDESAKGASKAEALRRSMLTLMARKDMWYFAHPAMWAPFVVVGEGNTEWAVHH